MTDHHRGFPPGRNVGTQLRARRAEAARAERERQSSDELALLPGDGAEARERLPDAQAWFDARDWQPFDFQRQTWREIAAGRSGLLHATTGAGKTHAVWFGWLNRLLAGATHNGRLRVLWLTPMRALAADTARALAAPLRELVPDVVIGVRTGDTDMSERARQATRLPDALITTPESLSVMLSRTGSREQLSDLDLVVVDEWHELIGNKRGVQVQLALARLRGWASRPLPIWGLSATLGNTAHAMQVLLNRDDGVLVQGEIGKPIVVDTLLPTHPGRFTWGGHLGIQMVGPAVKEIEASATTIVFTNTRSQAEIWYQAILERRPDWAGLVALHHGSLDRESRDWVEKGLKQGRLKAVVATSSLDLGVDFLPVERVLQIGSPKGVARLLQRAGRSGHAPDRVSRVTLVPTNALELIEAAAARTAVHARVIEPRNAPERPLDVLVQHLTTIAAGSGFDENDLLAEVRGTWSYRRLTDAEWSWALDFAGRGGAALRAYPDYRKVTRDDDGIYRVKDRRIAQRHRMSIGTIVSESPMLVKMTNGRDVGTIEEAFISRLRSGDAFLFGGKWLELVRVQEMTAYVRLARSKRGVVPRWAGGRMPLSSELADASLRELEAALSGDYRAPELSLLRPLIELQAKWSAVPTRDMLVAESMRSREGRHLFVYPFAGRHVHVGLASLLGYRIARSLPCTFSVAVNDYGFELLAPIEIDWQDVWRTRSVALLSETNLLEDALASLNAGELARRRFREIARVSGLTFTGYPGARKSVRQLQASSGLLYDVFREHDPANRLLGQAEREVLDQELEIGRMASALARMQRQRLVFRPIARPTPFAFPLMIERMREQVSTETLAARIERMVATLERAADGAQ